MSIDGYQNESVMVKFEKDLKEYKPDLVLIGMGAPIQEVWSEKHSSNSAGIWMGVGGSFDVWAGAKQRAPLWMRNLNLEWLFRLINDPRRLKRALSLPRFIIEIIKFTKFNN